MTRAVALKVVESVSFTLPPAAYRIGQVQPRLTYSCTLLRFFPGVPERRDFVDEFIRHQVFGAVGLCSLVAGQPVMWIEFPRGTTSSPTPCWLWRRAADMGNVLAQEHLGRINCLVVVVIHRADNQPRTPSRSSTRRPEAFAPLSSSSSARSLSYSKRHAVVQHHPIGDFAGQFHHRIAGRANHSSGTCRGSRRPCTTSSSIPSIMHRTPRETSRASHIQQAAHGQHGLLHCLQRFPAFDAHVLCQRAPPSAPILRMMRPARSSSVRNVAGQQADVARPVVDDA